MVEAEICNYEGILTPEVYHETFLYFFEGNRQMVKGVVFAMANHRRSLKNLTKLG